VVGHDLAMTARAFRFAADLQEPLPGSTWLDTARELEALGYSGIFVPDHVDEGPGPLTFLAAAAAVTSTIKVGTLVLDCDYRHPVFLAKELATIDVLSGGRLEVGLGAGWKRADYDITGIAMDRPGVRVSRLQEHAEILLRLWAGESVTFHGEHYRVTDAVLNPTPHTPVRPPILVGGGGPRLLRWAGRTADIVGVNPSIHSGAIDLDAARDSFADRIDQKVAWLREGAGDRFDQIEINAWLAIAEVTDDPSYAETVAGLFGTTADELRQSPMALLGTLTEAEERLHERRERWGYSYTVIPGTQARAFAPLVARLTGT